LVMGLRVNDGVSLARLGLLSDGRYDQNINGLINDGWLETRSGQLQTTQKGRPLLNEVLRQILAD